MDPFDVAFSFTSELENGCSYPAYSLDTLDYTISSPDGALTEILGSTAETISSRLTMFTPFSHLAAFGPRADGLNPAVGSLTSRLQYAFSEIMKGPKKMALENQTPWCHPYLYKDYMPQSMQSTWYFFESVMQTSRRGSSSNDHFPLPDAMACCGLYAVKNQKKLRRGATRCRVSGATARLLSASFLSHRPARACASPVSLSDHAAL